MAFSNIEIVDRIPLVNGMEQIEVEFDHNNLRYYGIFKVYSSGNISYPLELGYLESGDTWVQNDRCIDVDLFDELVEAVSAVVTQ
jgi:hypothetical protein